MHRWILLLAAAVCGPGARAAEPEPRIELGVGAIVLTVPDYRGSDHYDVQAFPVPYASYRSRNVQLTREGLRARLFTLDRLTSSISAAVNLTGRRDNPDRAGMPQLSPTLEIGPSLDYRVDEGPNWALRARLPLRGVMAIDGFRWEGLVAQPHLRFDYDQKLAESSLFWLASLGALWGSREYHEYYYGVATQYATPSRPAYSARSGYSGARASLSATWRLGRWRLGVFAADDWLDGASFEDSPLVKTVNNLTGGVFATYRLYERGGMRPAESESP